MRERRRLPGAKAVCALALAVGGLALVVTSLPFVGETTVADAAGPMVVGVALVGIACLMVGPTVRRRYDRWREIRRGIRQIETVLRLEAALSTRRVPVTGVVSGCPRCGMPLGPDGPACRCPRS